MSDLPLHVLALSPFDPGARRVSFELPEGANVAEIVARALPAASEADLGRVRIALVTERGSQIVPRELWSRCRPRPGVRVVIRVTPGKGSLRAVLSIVVSIAAVALGAMWGPGVATALGVSQTTAAAIVGLGVSIVGNLLINALIPPPKPDSERRDAYSITGWKNRLDPGGAVPFVLGTMRFAPPFAATPYTEIVGDWQYVRALFVLGEGEVQIDDMRLGETSLAEFDEVETEVRYGVEGELPVSLYPQQVVEEQIGVELTRPYPRNDDGEITQITETYIVESGPFAGMEMTRTVNAPTIETPVVRTTGADASGASIILAFPGGLVRYNDEGAKRTHSVSVRVEQRLVEAEEWQLVTTLEISAKKAEAFFRQHSWSFPSRARWQIRLTMLTDETEDSQIAQRTNWLALQTIRPEYPLNYPRPLALVALRIKATHQLSGALDDFNCLVSRVCADWDAGTATWVRQVNESPAAAFREALQHASNPKAVADAGLDLEWLANWSEWCAAEGLTYNAVLEDKGTTLRDVLAEIAAAGRATPRHDGLKWGVVIDRPLVDTLIVDHINPRNSWGFKWARAYTEPPHAFTVKFRDAGNDYQETERVVRWPGYSGDITLTEQLPLPGKVHADEVWREARRRQLEILLRPDTYEVTQDGAVRATTRGDRIALSHDVLSRVQVAARIKSVLGTLVEIDERVMMISGTTYAIRFRVFEDDDDGIGTSIIRTVKTVPGESTLLTLTGSGAMPEAGDVVHFGPSSAESYEQIVTRIEATTDRCAIIKTVDAAPQIDIELAATEIPAWSSRVGAELDDNLLQPSAPRFTSVSSGAAGTGTAGLISYLLTAGSGAVPTASYQVEHRLEGAVDWVVSVIPAANGGGSIDVYATGEIVEIRACPISATGVYGPYTPTLTITVGGADAAIPAALDADAISVTTLLGGALIQVATGPDEATARIQLYRSTSAVLDRETDAVGAPIAVVPQQSYSLTVGDTTRASLLSVSAWTTDAGWALVGGEATHTPGTADAISQALAATAGKYYRIGYTVDGRTAGNVHPRLIGGSDRPGVTVSADGAVTDRIQAVTGNDTIEWVASSDFDGSVTDLVAYLETSACLGAGTHYVWLEPVNADGVPGPVSGPYTLEIV